MTTSQVPPSPPLVAPKQRLRGPKRPTKLFDNGFITLSSGLFLQGHCVLQLPIWGAACRHEFQSSRICGPVVMNYSNFGSRCIPGFLLGYPLNGDLPTSVTVRLLPAKERIRQVISAGRAGFKCWPTSSLASGRQCGPAVGGSLRFYSMGCAQACSGSATHSFNRES